MNPNFLLMKIFYLPANLNFALLRASKACGICCYYTLIDINIVPISTLAAFPNGLPKAPLIPVCSLSAPAQESILLILRTWKGCTLIFKWKTSFPALVDIYLLAAILAASKASEVIYSYSSETKWIQ